MRISSLPHIALDQPRLLRRGTGHVPTAIRGLTHWFNAKDISTLYLKSDMSTGNVVNHLDPVGRWQNRCGNGFDLLQATDAKRATYRAADFNGLPCVDITADPVGLLCNSMGSYSYSEFTVLASAWCYSANTDYRYFMSFGYTGIAQEFNDVNGCAMVQELGTANWYIQHKLATAIAGISDANKNLLAFQWSAADQLLGINKNGGAITTGVDATVNPMVVDGLSLGSNFAISGNYMSVRYGEILIYNRKLKRIELNSMKNYLTNEWLLTTADYP